MRVEFDFSDLSIKDFPAIEALEMEYASKTLYNAILIKPSP